MEKIGTNMIEFVVLVQFSSIRAKWCHPECYVSYLRFKVSFLSAFVVSLMPICHVPTKSNKCMSLWKTFLKAHSHRAKAKILFDVCRLFFDLFCSFFDLFRFRYHFCLLWIDSKTRLHSSRMRTACLLTVS